MAILVATGARFIEFGEEERIQEDDQTEGRGISKTQTIQVGSGMRKPENGSLRVNIDHSLRRSCVNNPFIEKDIA